MRHVGKFEDQMELLGVSGDYRCRVFPTTLSDTAQEWYWKFKPGSIESWENFRKEFCHQFSTAHTPPVYANNLADLKTREGRVPKRIENHMVNCLFLGPHMLKAHTIRRNMKIMNGQPLVYSKDTCDRPG